MGYGSEITNDYRVESLLIGRHLCFTENAYFSVADLPMRISYFSISFGSGGAFDVCAVSLDGCASSSACLAIFFLADFLAAFWFLEDQG